MTVAWPKNVRIAREEDEADLFDLLMALYKENGVGVVPRPADIRQAIRAGTRERNGVLIGVVDGSPGMLAGSVCIVPTTWWYNAEFWYLSQRWFFVHPEFRQDAAIEDGLFDFMRAYQALCEENSTQKWPLVASVTSMARIEEEMALWHRHGRLVGGIYVIDGDAQPAAEAAE